MITKFWTTDSLLKKKHSKQDVFFQIKLFCNWYCGVMCSGEVDLLLIYNTVLHKQPRNTQTKKYWLEDNPRLIHKVTLHDIKTVVWYTVSARRVTGPIFFPDTIHSEGYSGKIVTFFKWNLWVVPMRQCNLPDNQCIAWAGLQTLWGSVFSWTPCEMSLICLRIISVVPQSLNTLVISHMWHCYQNILVCCWTPSI
jgi:hypothetical protein